MKKTNLLDSLKLINNNIQNNKYSFDSNTRIGALMGISSYTLFTEYYSQYVTNQSNVNTERIFNLCLEKINSGNIISTYSDGISGFLWILQFLQKNNFVEHIDDNLFKSLDLYIQEWIKLAIQNNNFDFMHGATGHIYYLLSRIEKASINQEIKLLINLFIEGLSYRLREIIEYKLLKKEQHFKNRTYLGIAHGIAGIIFILSKITSIPELRVKSLDLIQQYVSFLFSIKKQNKTSLFPSWLAQSTNDTNDSALSWCNGDIGIGIALLNTAENIQDENLKNQAFNFLIHSSKRTTYDSSWISAPYLCHGYLGAYKIFSRAYTVTGEKEFKKAKEYWLKIGIDSILKEMPSDLTLLYGQTGIGLTLIDAYTNTDHPWGETLLIS